MICNELCKLIINLYLKEDPFILKKENEDGEELQNGSEDSRPIKE